MDAPVIDQRSARTLFVRTKDELSSRIRYNVEGVWRIGAVFLIHGWILDPDRQISAVVVGKPASKRVYSIDKVMTRFQRQDVADAFPALCGLRQGQEGFAAVVSQLPEPEDTTSLAITVVTKDGRAYSELARVRELNSLRDATQLVFGLTGNGLPDYLTCRNLYYPVINAATELRRSPSVAIDAEFGDPPADPSISVIVPIYGSLDLMQFQIGNLVRLAPTDAELVFAIDDPRLWNGSLKLAKRLSTMLPISFRLVAPQQNLGFAGINNFAVNLSRGRNTLLLNSDCFIADPTCMQRVISVLDSGTADILGARLLFADRTIQHDGVAFARKLEHPGFMLNDHPHKGIPSSLISPSKPEQSVALTAAFMAFRRTLYDQAGGLDEGYVRGDFEDSDFCLNAISKGLTLGIIRDKPIFHLERQSQNKGLDSTTAMKITLTNAVRQMCKWESLLSNDLPKIKVIQ